MYSKEQIYSLALSALLLTKQVTDVNSDTSNQVAVLNIHWQPAFFTTLTEMNLDATATTVPLELIQTLNSYDSMGVLEGYNGQINPWQFVYKYPSNCCFFRRISSCVRKDNRMTQVPKKIGLFNGIKAIFTDQEQAIGEIIPSTIDLNALPPAAGLAIAYKLAMLSAPLITGKGAVQLMQQLDTKYKVALNQAQMQDQQESFSFDEDWVDSEFVAARMS